MDEEKRREERSEEDEEEEEKEDEGTQRKRAQTTKQGKDKANEMEITKGYMHSHGKPRQPKETQQNKAGTLRYEQTTETWHCTKCDKKYSKQNARSAKSHANGHTRAEAKQKIENGKKPNTMHSKTKTRPDFGR